MKFSTTVLAAAITMAGASNKIAFAEPMQPDSDFVTVTLLNPVSVDHEFNAEEQDFLASALIKAYGKVHDHLGQLDLDSLDFMTQNHEAASSGKKSGSLRSAAAGPSYHYDTTRFFPKWTCDSCTAFPEFIEDFVSDSETLKQHGGSCGPKCRPDDDELELTASKAPHEAWENKLCKILKKSNFAVFASAEKCSITFDSAEYVQQHGGSCGPKCRPDDDELEEEPVSVGVFKSMIDYIKQHGGSCGPKCRPDDDEMVEEVPEPVKQHGGSCGPKCRPDDDELKEEVPEPEPVKQHGGSCGPKCRPDDDELKEEVPEPEPEPVKKELKQHGGSCGPKCRPDDDELKEEVPEPVPEPVKELKQHGGSCGPKCRPDDDELKEVPIGEKVEELVEEVEELVEEIKEIEEKPAGDLKQHGGSCGPKCRPDDDELELKKN